MILLSALGPAAQVTRTYGWPAGPSVTPYGNAGNNLALVGTTKIPIAATRRRNTYISTSVPASKRTSIGVLGSEIDAERTTHRSKPRSRSESSAVSLASGQNALGEEVDEKLEVKDGTQMIRYYKELYL